MVITFFDHLSCELGTLLPVSNARTFFPFSRSFKLSCEDGALIKEIMGL